MKNRPGGHLKPPVLMAVHAHPDDESSTTGGTLARYAAAGLRTVLITCTDGGQGDAPGAVKPGSPGHRPHVVAQRRSKELDLATAALGVIDVVKLAYPDSGMSEVSTDAISNVASQTVFSQLPLEPLVQQMVSLMRHFRPAVALPYPPNGMSGHPDHIRVHEVVAAAHRIVLADSSPNRGEPRLYYTALSRSRLNDVTRAARAMHGENFGAARRPSRRRCDDHNRHRCAGLLGEKLRALSAHASQSDATALHRIFSAPAERSRRRTEEFVGGLIRRAVSTQMGASSTTCLTASPPGGSPAHPQTRRRADKPSRHCDQRLLGEVSVAYWSRLFGQAKQ